MKTYLVFILFIGFTSFNVTYGQMAINTDGTLPDASAMLDIKSSSKGLLLPRLTSAERTAISSPATGLLVFQTDAPAGYYFYSGTGWQIVGGSGLSGSGSNGQIAFWTGAGTISGNNNLSWDIINYRLGIGTSFPAYKLSVEGTMGLLETGTSPVYHSIFQGGNQSGDITYTLPVASPTVSGQVLTSTTGGILSWTSAENPVTFQNGLTRSGNVVELGGPLSASTTLTLDGAETMTFMNSGTGHITMYLANTGDFRILDNGSAFFTATDEGKVGIGTIAPNEQLEITGNMRLPASTATTGIIYAGSLPFIHSFGSNNNFFGQLSGNFSLSGADNNSAVGDSSLYSITTGDRNLAFGTGALKALTTATGNTGIGYRAGWKLTDANATGGYNTMVGYQAGMNNNGNRNTFLGCEAGYSNTNAVYNTFIGHQAGYNNVTASRSVAVGYRALFSQVGAGWPDNNNVAVGFEALYMNNPSEDGFGYANVGVGSEALRANTDGSGNTAIGWNSLKSCTVSYDNTAVGSRTLEVHVDGASNTAIGKYALGSSETGYHNTAIGALASSEIVSGYNNTSLGCYTGPGSESLYNTISIGYQVSVTSSNKTVIGNTSMATIGGYADWSVFSDRRLKENIIYRSEPGLDFILKLRPVSYNYIKDENKRRRDGLIAQDVQAALESLNMEFSGLAIDDDPDRTMNLSYADFVIPLINAVQEQQKTIDRLQNQIDALTQAMVKLSEIRKE